MRHRATCGLCKPCSGIAYQLDAERSAGAHRLQLAVMDERSDADLLQAIRDGERSAWDQLVKKHERRLWAIARARGLDPAAAHDALPGTWLSLLDYVDRIRDPAALGGWLATVTKREAIRLSKQQARERERAEKLGSRHTMDGTSADADIIRDENLAGLAEHVRTSPRAL